MIEGDVAGIEEATDVELMIDPHLGTKVKREDVLTVDIKDNL